MTFLRRLNAAMSPAAMLVAILALVVAAGGAGYAAGQIGTSGIKNKAITTKKIKNNAVTSPKIKANAVNGSKVANRSLTAADLVAEKRYTVVGTAGAPGFSNGGEGDCKWTLGSSQIAGLGAPGFRVDRFGTVHLTGVAVSEDNVGGDASCDPNDANQNEDGIMFILPAAYRPARSQIVSVGDGAVFIVGGSGATLPGSDPLPPGAVWLSNTTVGLLDGISYEAAGSPLVTARATRSERINPTIARELLGVG